MTWYLATLGYLDSLQHNLPTMRVVEGPHGLVELEPALVQSVRCYRGQTPLEDVSSLSGVAHCIPDTEDLLPGNKARALIILSLPGKNRTRVSHDYPPKDA